MTFNRSVALLIVSTVLLALAGCPGQDEVTEQSGIEVHLHEVHVEDRNPTAVREVGVNKVMAAVAATDVAGSYDYLHLESHEITDAHAHVLALYRACLVLDDVELVKCPSVAELPGILLNGMMRTAAAHAGHGSVPVGGRALDKPNVIDIVTQEGYFLPLGDAAVAPGRYCGLRVSLARMGTEAYGKPAAAKASSDDPTTVPEVPELSGKSFAIRADYCSAYDGLGVCIARTKVDIDDGGVTVPAARTIDFATPLEVSTALPEAYVALGIAYGEWAENLDISLLATDPGEVEKLMNNIAGSLHIYSKGWGDLEN
jgi:hypothetical protein